MIMGQLFHAAHDRFLYRKFLSAMAKNIFIKKHFKLTFDHGHSNFRHTFEHRPSPVMKLDSINIALIAFLPTMA